MIAFCQYPITRKYSNNNLCYVALNKLNKKARTVSPYQFKVPLFQLNLIYLLLTTKQTI